MDEQLNRAEGALDSLEQRHRYDERNRLTLLVVHALIGIGAGFFLTIDGLPIGWRNWTGDLDAVRWAVGLTPLVGGSVLLLGLLRGRRLLEEALGMLLMLIWDTAMTAMWIHSAMTDTTGVRYPVVVYGGICALMGVHLTTLLAYLVRGRRDTD